MQTDLLNNMSYVIKEKGGNTLLAWAYPYNETLFYAELQQKPKLLPGL